MFDLAMDVSPMEGAFVLYPTIAAIAEVGKTTSIPLPAPVFWRICSLWLSQIRQRITQELKSRPKP